MNAKLLHNAEHWLCVVESGLETVLSRARRVQVGVALETDKKLQQPMCAEKKSWLSWVYSVKYVCLKITQKASAPLLLCKVKCNSQ